MGTVFDTNIKPAKKNAARIWPGRDAELTKAVNDQATCITTSRGRPTMSQLSFDTFFYTATGNAPYDYQSRLAGNDSGTVCRSQLINIPTGLGKTAAVTLAWLWNRAHLHKPEWPRRLIYCLPMRTLVEQTQDEVQKWLKAHDLNWDEKPKTRKGKVGVHILMGGEEAGEWDIYPEENTILIGTQDMLLSRALNRGYGMSRYRWPMHFGLLNNDCLWVMDETQLMGVGVETSAQLDGFRHNGKMTTFGACPTWWMSATLEESRLTTVDHPAPSSGGWPRLELSKEEKEKPGSRPKALFEAKKAVSRCELALSPTLKGDDYAKQLAAVIAKQHLALLEKPHEKGTLTLVVVNRVARAQEIYKALTTAEKKSRQPLYDPACVALIHSRFRQKDREKHEKLLFSKEDDKADRIVIATQAVEAGVDVSARLLITELAPWSSLVQRVGRCNRRADISDAEVLWVDIEPKDESDDLSLPYLESELSEARKAIGKLTDVSSQALREVKVPEISVIRPVIRRRDLVDLFDTTPDICGQDLDVSRYIRDGDDNDVQFFWRIIEDGASPTAKEPPPHRDELCRVSIGDAAKFLGKKPRAWKWNPLAEEWEEAKTARPGAVYLVAVNSGGYSEVTGWTGDPKDKEITPYPPQDGINESYAGNRLSFTRDWQTLAAHTAQVVAEMKAIASTLTLVDAEVATLLTAAQWHDIGKTHGEFQAMLVRNDISRQNTLWAKSENKNGRCARYGFRHELASALAWLLAGSHDAPERDLTAYLIAAHHGKVRLSIRALPDETGNEKYPERLFARGIWHGDTLPAVSLGEITTPEITLDLGFIKMGEGEHGPSWLARMVALRDRIDLGPFRLAYLETLLRAADARASRETT
jgi:CRISPR-associated endonuclease/helicase Cas3